MPIFVKAGTILPLGPSLQFATQESDEALQIKVFPGKDAKYILYFDDNESYEYEQGIYSELNLTYFESSKSLSIETGYDKYTHFDKNPLELIITLPR